MPFALKQLILPFCIVTTPMTQSDINFYFYSSQKNIGSLQKELFFIVP